MAVKRTFLDNPYRKGWRTIPGKAVRNSENHYRETRNEHPAWIGTTWYPPDHIPADEVEETETDTADTETFLT